MYTCVYIHTHTNTYTYACIPMRTQCICIRPWGPSCIHICMYIPTHCIHTRCLFIHICIDVHTHTHVQTQTCIHIFVYAHTASVCTHSVLSHTYIPIHTCTKTDMYHTKTDIYACIYTHVHIYVNICTHSRGFGVHVCKYMQTHMYSAYTHL